MPMELQENATRTSNLLEDANKAHPSVRGLRRVSGLSYDRVSFRIPTNDDAKIHVHDTHGHESWRARILHFLHQPIVQWTLIGLLLLDVVILFTELFLGAHVSHCVSCLRRRNTVAHVAVSKSDYSILCVHM